MPASRTPRACRPCGQLGGKPALLWTRSGSSLSMKVVSPWPTFLERALCPQLRPGEVVVLDNLRVHQVAGAPEALAQAGARLRYLPPYSPDDNPIEFAWSKVKSLLRARAARTRTSLQRALGTALQTITPQNARALKNLGHHFSDQTVASILRPLGLLLLPSIASR
jgi:transposase